jgi:hypothetical protein
MIELEPKVITPTHECPQCGTQYFEPKECDWCPVKVEPIKE